MYLLVVTREMVDSCISTASATSCKTMGFMASSPCSRKPCWRCTMQVATLSGLIGKLYYTFISRDADRKYLQPARDNGVDYIFEFIPLVKTTPDMTYYQTLAELDLTSDEWVMGGDLLNKLKNSQDNDAFTAMSFEHFKNQYLNRMAGQVIDEQRGLSGEKDRPIKINEQGQALIAYLLDDLVSALVDRSKSHTALVAQCKTELDQYKRR